MTVFRFRFGIAGLGLVVLSFIAGTSFSRIYWGYWFSPPEIGARVSDFVTLHSFARVDAASSAPNLGWTYSFLSPAEISEGAWAYRRSPVDGFWLRLHAAVEDANLQLSSQSVAAERTLGRVEKEIAASKLLVEGEPGYPSAKRLSGYAAIGAARSGETLIVLALKGSEESNDHYPVFDFTYACGEEGCRLLHESRYFEDIAGFEGFRWQWGFLAALCVAFAVVVPATGLWFLTIGVIRLLRMAAAAIGATH